MNVFLQILLGLSLGLCIYIFIHNFLDTSEIIEGVAKKCSTYSKSKCKKRSRCEYTDGACTELGSYEDSYAEIGEEVYTLYTTDTTNEDEDEDDDEITFDFHDFTCPSFQFDSTNGLTCSSVQITDGSYNGTTTSFAETLETTTETTEEDDDDDDDDDSCRQYDFKKKKCKKKKKCRYITDNEEEMYLCKSK